MRINWKIVSGILATALTYDEIAGLINKKKFAELKKNRDVLSEMNLYLVNVMDQRQTPFTEFDRIAVQTIADKLNTK